MRHLPAPLANRFRRALIDQRFKTKPKASHSGQPLIFSGKGTTLAALTSVRVIGHEYLLRPAERRAVPIVQRQGPGTVIDHLSHIALTLHHDDRARHDRENWQADLERSNQQWQDRVRATNLRRDTRLKGPTLAILLTETPRAPWDARTDLISPEATAQIRHQTRMLMLALGALGPEMPRAAVRSFCPPSSPG